MFAKILPKSSRERTWNINSWANETLLGQLDGQTSRDSLQLGLRVKSWIDLDTSFGTT